MPQRRHSALLRLVLIHKGGFGECLMTDIVMTYLVQKSRLSHASASSAVLLIHDEVFSFGFVHHFICIEESWKKLETALYHMDDTKAMDEWTSGLLLYQGCDSLLPAIQKWFVTAMTFSGGHEWFLSIFHLQSIVFYSGNNGGYSVMRKFSHLFLLCILWNHWVW